MSQRFILYASISLVTLLIGLAGFYALDSLIEWKEEPYHTPYSGEALHNPYYATQLLMQKLGYPAQTHAEMPNTNTLEPNATLILDESSLPGLRDPLHQKKLLDWIKAGGHLVIEISYTAKIAEQSEEKNDTPEHSDEDTKTAAASDTAPSLFKQLGIKIENTFNPELKITEEAQADARKRNHVCIGYVSNEASDETNSSIPNQNTPKKTEEDCSLKIFNTVQLDGKTLRAKFGTYSIFSFTLDKPAEWEIQLPKGISETYQPATVAARYAYGKGWVTATPLELFQNRQISHQQNAELFVRMSTLPNEDRPIHFVLSRSYPSLLQWIMQTAPQAIWAGALLLLLLIWHFMPRFGPMRPPVSTNRPGLLQHLRAVGEFHMRHDNYVELIAPLREELKRALLPLRAHYPQIRHIAELAAHVSGLNAQEINNALEATPRDRMTFTEYTRILTHLLDHLRGRYKTK